MALPKGNIRYIAPTFSPELVAWGTLLAPHRQTIIEMSESSDFEEMKWIWLDDKNIVTSTKSPKLATSGSDYIITQYGTKRIVPNVTYVSDDYEDEKELFESSLHYIKDLIKFWKTL